LSAYCYLTTTGRRTGTPHTIEIWFGRREDTLYLLAGGRERSDWVRNLRKQPECTVRIADATYGATARVLEPDSDEDALARRLLLEKYAKGYSGDLTDWGRTALPVALDLKSEIAPGSLDQPRRRGKD
jgi:deazaflavin-dependent oxidoreductase (nitroreductase family)